MTPTLTQACDKHARDGPSDARDFPFRCCWPEERGLSSSYTPKTPNATPHGTETCVDQHFRLSFFLFWGDIWAGYNQRFVLILMILACTEITCGACRKWLIIVARETPFAHSQAKSVRQYASQHVFLVLYIHISKSTFSPGQPQRGFGRNDRNSSFELQIKFLQTDQKWILIFSAWVGIRQSSKPFLRLSDSVHYVSHKTIENQLYASFYCLVFSVPLLLFLVLRAHFITAVAQATANLIEFKSNQI